MEPIAIIGSGCRFPGGASSSSKLWDLLQSPLDLVRKIPIERFDSDGFYHPNGPHHGTSNVQYSYILDEDHREFDAQFFNVKPVEADSMDPQQRMLLEVVYECLEAAGLSLNALRGSSTAVYIGQMCNDYNDHLLRDLDTVPTYFATGTSRAILSNRVSYFFDWHGPSMTIDTACSSSLVALHQAVQALRSGQSPLAIVGGANLLLGPEWFISESNLKMLSPHGRSRMWDIDADGYARGDGVAAVLLKPLSAALADGDHIESIIRESGINQDGRTKGITFPSGEAQGELIRQTYARAGLDPRKPEDRCQYFEAHGTGTQAGDPQEASAISEAFFSGESEGEQPLYVGSIKTVIGHTEGTAGIAGVLKASLALQNGMIPPNLHFNTLNPSVGPFYKHLRIATTIQPWPQLPNGVPRRASVNSFGFGGTNAHVILESYHAPSHADQLKTVENFLPFVFSAASNSSLVALITAYLAYLKENPNVNLRNLAWTLAVRRSVFPVKTTVSALSVGELVRKLEIKGKELRENSIQTIEKPIKSPSILGIFTGQGAQWASMGASLIRSSTYASQFIDSLETSLSELPVKDRPTWSLRSELLAEVGSSRIGDASLAQPLCTALQLLMVELLRVAGIRFAAVVGHSSGEIVAAYAAGFLSSADAMKVSYYRGLYAKLATGPNGIPGAMLAVGLSLEEAHHLCDSSKFKNRVSVAAFNSSSSVTLSGDADAVEEIRVELTAQRKFARALKVNTAYHSHHMIPCSEPYVNSLRESNVTVLRPAKPSCRWFSSVNGGKLVNGDEDLQDLYWRDNLLNTVFFSQAVEQAVINSLPFDCAVEIGPHPALKGPASQTIQEASGREIDVPYVGVLTRGEDDVESFAEALGSLWVALGEQNVSLEGYLNIVSGGSAKPSVCKGLPGYCWDHDRLYWTESRLTRSIRTRKQVPHELLGVLQPQTAEGCLQWRNFLRPKEVPWLSGHQIQGQIVLPAAAYIAMALEASKYWFADIEIQLLEILDFTIHRGIAFPDENSEVEIIFTVNAASPASSDHQLLNFSLSSSSAKQKETLVKVVTGHVRMTSDSVIPHISLFSVDNVGLNNVNNGAFYSALDDIGYGYSGQFRTLSNLRRKLNYATGILSDPSPTTSLMLHPATLDLAIQGNLLAYSSPLASLWSLHVPTSIRRLTVNPLFLPTKGDDNRELPFECRLDDESELGILGDFNIYTPDGVNVIVQAEGLRLVPFSSGSAGNDRIMFSKTVWKSVFPSQDAFDIQQANENDLSQLNLENKVAYHYFKTTVLKSISPAALQLYPSLINLARDIDANHADNSDFSLDGDHVSELVQRYPHDSSLKILRSLGSNIRGIVDSNGSAVDTILSADLLREFWEQDIVASRSVSSLASAVSHIIHQHGSLDIMEFAPLTTAVAKRIFQLAGPIVPSYTYANSSSILKDEVHKFNGDDVVKIALTDLDYLNGNEDGDRDAYDVIIHPFPFQVTRDLQKKLRNLRSLLKPGGFLLSLEVPPHLSLKTKLVLATLPGFHDSIIAPSDSLSQLHSLLKVTGFSGVDAVSTGKDQLTVLATQAVDEQVKHLRQLLQARIVDIEHLIIIGGKSVETLRYAAKLQDLLESHSQSIRVVSGLGELAELEIPLKSTILSLSELDSPTFASLCERTLLGLQKIFNRANVILWITEGVRGANPYATAFTGFARTAQLENPHVSLQQLDKHPSQQLNTTIVAEILLRLCITSNWKKSEFKDRLLWSTEPELALENNHVLIPRILPIEEKNLRYNSYRRPVIQRKSIKDMRLWIQPSGSGYAFREDLTKGNGGPATVEIQVKYSILSSIRVDKLGQLFLISGTLTATGQDVVAFSPRNASTVDVPQSWAVSWSISPQAEIENLYSLACYLLADYVLSHVPQGSSVLVHEPESLLFSIWEKSARAEGKFMRGTTSKPSNSDKYIFLNPAASRRDLECLLQNDSSIFIDLSQNSDVPKFGSKITSILSPATEIYELQNLVGSEASIHWKSLPQTPRLAEILERFLLVAAETEPLETVPIVTLQQLPNLEQVSKLSVIDWTKATYVPVSVHPADFQPLFRGDRTYLLFGLTGSIGQSLCKWMIRKGAKNIVISSRNPRVEPQWLEKLRSQTAVIQVIPCDISDRTDVQRLRDQVSSLLPPIGGIVNGAMVLEDAPLSSMNLAMMKQALKPKIDGSKNLDEVFSTADLEFFIMFSSVTGVTGSYGQANYTAANMFMAGLAVNRRRRGLVASTIDIGVVCDIGYLASGMSQSIEDNLRKVSSSWVTERDLHIMFAEAVITGRNSELPEDAELITGIDRVSSNDPVKTHWISNPRFRYFIRKDGRSSREMGLKGVASIRQRLLLAKQVKDIQQIIEEAFCSKLQTLLQLSLDGGRDLAWLLQQRADDLGVDSLIAVEVRTWFLNELEVDIPVLRTLGGATIAELIHEAIEKLSTSPTPSPHGQSTPGSLTTVNTPQESTSSPPSEWEESGQTSKEETSSEASSISYVDLPEKKPNPIVRTSRLSLGQSRFWFLHSYLEDQTTFNITVLFRVSGPLQVPVFSRAVKKFAERHETLRTRFFIDDDGYPIQAIMESSLLQLETRKIQSEEDAWAEFRRLRDHVFDLERGETIRLSLLTRSDKLHYFIISYHHINMDGVSFQVLLSDLEKLYTSQQLPTKICQFPDFTARISKEIESGTLEPDLRFWKAEFPDFPPTLALFPFAKVSSRRVLKRYDHHEAGFLVSLEVAEKIRQICKRFKVTPFHFYLSTLKIMLMKLLEIDDVCIGIADANRHDSDTLQSLGMFLNLLPLRFRSQTGETFSETLIDTRKKAYSALQHSRVPFDLLLDELEVPRSASYSPLFQVWFDYRQGGQEHVNFADCHFEGLQYNVGRTAYDLGIDVWENAGSRPHVILKGQTYLYSESDTQLLLDRYQTLLESFASDPSLDVESAPLFRQADVDRAIELGRGPLMESHWPDTLAHRIDQVVEANERKIAVKDGFGSVLTYAKLKQRADVICEKLWQAGVSDSSRVAVFQEPTVDWICSLYGIMRAGAVYVPLDLRNPIPRLAAIVKAAEPSVILAHSFTLDQAPELAVARSQILNVSEIISGDAHAAGTIVNRARSHSPAVILFTSGSTGTPKGIVVKHSGLRNEMEGYVKTLGIGSENILQQSAFSFDFSMDQIFTSLSNAGTLYMVPKTKRGDPVEISKILAAEKITYTKATPSEYTSWLRYGTDSLRRATSWKFAFGGGETFTDSLRREFRKIDLPELRLFNSYGPAEITVSSSKIPIPYKQGDFDESDERIPAGLSLPNYSVYIVNENLQPLPVGMPGEVLIGGAGVSLGYLNNENLTKQKYLHDNFAPPAYVEKGWTRAYRTGDKAYMRGDGALVFIGRMDGDTFVKLRGLRIDLGDVENSILRTSQGTLTNAVVSVRGDPEFLVAHVVFSHAHSIQDQQAYLRQLLSQLPLPQYMCPALAIPLKEMPLNNHFKTDRRAISALPLPEVSSSSELSYDGELSDIESQLLLAWQEVLPREIMQSMTFSPHTGFFQAGGSSVLLPRLQVLIRERFDVALPLVEIMESNTLGTMAAKIEGEALLEEIDWDEETSLHTASLDHSKSNTAAGNSHESQIILLTGSTGFLGRNILRKLVEDDTVSRIHCVAVRNIEKRTFPVVSDKIIVHAGDLADSRMGLSEEIFEALAQEVTAIIHAGAVRAFWEFYQLIRKPNFVSTKELVALAAARRIPVHFVSSGGLLPFTGQGSTYEPISVTAKGDFRPPADGSNGYLSAKWASEAVLEKAAQQLGIPVRIYRTIPLVNTEPSTETFDEWLQFANSMKIVPVVGGLKGEFDIIPIQTVAGGIITQLARDHEDGTKAEPLVFAHYQSVFKIDMQSLAQHIQTNRQPDLEFTNMDILKWIGRVKAEGFPYQVAAQDLTLDPVEGWTGQPLRSQR